MTQGYTGHRCTRPTGLSQHQRLEISAVLAPQSALSIDQSFHRPHDLLRGDDRRLPSSTQDGFTERIRRIACFNPRARTGRDKKLAATRAITTPLNVSIHAPARGATSRLRGRIGGERVSIHAPARGATPAVPCRVPSWRGFNPRARTGRDHRQQQSFVGDASFNPRARTGRDGCSLHVAYLSSCFNPRARTGRDDGFFGLIDQFDVSIHAPARGATRGRRLAADDCPVSIHAPARGATAARTVPASASACFNPRARTGRDEVRDTIDVLDAVFQSTRPHGARPDATREVATDAIVSIHAPARGATRYRIVPSKSSPVSIHAPARGATVTVAIIHAPSRVSIHAPARGATYRRSSQSIGRIGFQSTRPHGARRAHMAKPDIEKLFQSTRPHGARPSCCPHRLAGACFNPRARTGRDMLRTESAAREGEFQSTRPHGARPKPPITAVLAKKFQSTRPHGARRTRRTTETAPTTFQSTRPHGARPR